MWWWHRTTTEMLGCISWKSYESFNCENYRVKVYNRRWCMIQNRIPVSYQWLLSTEIPFNIRIPCIYINALSRFFSRWVYVSQYTNTYAKKQSGWQLKWRSTVLQRHNIILYGFTLNVCGIEKLKLSIANDDSYRLFLHSLRFFFQFSVCVTVPGDCECESKTIHCSFVVLLWCCFSQCIMSCVWVSFCYGLSQSHIVLFRIYLGFFSSFSSHIFNWIV